MRLLLLLALISAHHVNALKIKLQNTPYYTAVELQSTKPILATVTEQPNTVRISLAKACKISNLPNTQGTLIKALTKQSTANANVLLLTKAKAVHCKVTKRAANSIISIRCTNKAVNQAKPNSGQKFNPLAPKKQLVKAKTSETIKQQRPKAKTRQHSQHQAKRVVKILIDPGHGGRDGGAVSSTGLKEKEVTLRVSKLLAKHLRALPGIVVELTRTTDKYLTTRQRLLHARKHVSDLFISIHADSFHDNRCHGAGVYMLADRSATSESAKWIAARKNYSVLAGTLDLKQKDSMLRKVLLDLSQTATKEESLLLGNTILKELTKSTTMHAKRLEKAPFDVLKSPDIPSVLIELGFISNKQEAKKLADPKHQLVLVKAITRAIDKYVQAKPKDFWV